MVLSEDHGAMGAMPIFVAHTATWGHRDILAPAAADVHVWVLCPTTTSVCVDVTGP